MTAKRPEAKTRQIEDCLGDGTYLACCCLKADCPSCALAHLLRVLHEKEATITTLKSECDEAFRKGAEAGAAGMRHAIQAAAVNGEIGCGLYQNCGSLVGDQVGILEFTPHQEGE